jgi:phosphatidylserine/phosphatidylglycerophosphate/cardiolipin synthase-like enzyme
MTSTSISLFTKACSDLIGQVAANPTLADAIVIALASGQLTNSSGPMSISNVVKGAPGSHHLKEFLKAWKSSAAHLGAKDVSSMVESSLASYRLAHDRAHDVDIVWTGPEVSGSQARRTEAVVREMVCGADKALLIVGYWLVTSTVQIKDLIDLLIDKARMGVLVRFVFDPGEKSSGPDNFEALEEKWPADLEGAPRQVYTWSDHMAEVESKTGHKYDRKLHAKVIVVDGRDALVTSANLTHAGLLENLEMGLRVQGFMAGAVVRHYDLLISEGILERRE